MNMRRRNIGKKRPVRKPKQAPWSTKQQLVIGGVCFFVIALILAAVYYGSRIERMQITDIEVIGGITIPHSEIESTVRDQLQGTFFLLVPRTFSLLYPKSEIQEAVQYIDRVKQVRVERNGLQKIIIAFEEHIPVGLWCGVAEQCYFLERNGLAFGEAPTLDGTAFIRFIDGGVEPANGVIGFNADFMRDHLNLSELFVRELDLYVATIEKQAEHDVDYTFTTGGSVKFSQTADLETSFNNLLTVLQSDDFVHLSDGSFDYIDLRFGDKVFVNEKVVATSTTETATSSDAAGE